MLAPLLTHPESAGPDNTSTRKLTPPLIGELVLTHLGKQALPLIKGVGELAPPLTWGVWSQQSRLTNLATIKAHIQGLELIHPNSYAIYDLLKGTILQIHNHRISMIWGNNKITERNLSEGPLLMVYQKPEAMNLTKNTLHNERLQVKLLG